MKRSRDLAGLTTLAGATALAFALSACSTQSPSVITTPYPASDGVSGTIGSSGVDLRNFLAIGATKGSPAEVIGVVVNDTASPITVSLMTDPGPTAQPTQTQVQVAPHGTTSVGPQAGSTQVLITQLAVAPGALIGLSAQTQSGGTLNLSIPVLPPQGYYAGLTPGATPSPTGTSTPSQTMTPLTSGTATPTTSATTKAKKKRKKATATPTATASPTS